MFKRYDTRRTRRRMNAASPISPRSRAQVVVDCCQLDKKDCPIFSFSAYKSMWQYTYTVSSGPNTYLPRVNKFSICVRSQTFNPEKFEHLFRILSRIYSSTGEPTKILQAVLSVNASNKLAVDASTEPSGLKPWNADEYDDKRAMLANSSLKKLISCFGEKSILLWIAVLLKKRIFVVGDKWSDVLFVVRTLPQFAWIRQDVSILRPMIVMKSKEQQEELLKSGVYIAGTVDANIRGRSDLYDIIVDMKARTIVVQEGSKSSFDPPRGLADFAKETARKAGEESVSETDMIKWVAVKTKGYVDGLKKLAARSGDGKVTLEALRSQKLPQRMVTFLHNLALAERLV